MGGEGKRRPNTGRKTSKKQSLYKTNSPNENVERQTYAEGRGGEKLVGGVDQKEAFTSRANEIDLFTRMGST